MINKENLLKNRAAVQGNRSYIEQQVKSVAPTRAESTIVPNSPPRALSNANKLSTFNVMDLNTAGSSRSSSSSASHGFGQKRNLSSSQPDSEDIRLENLRQQAAQRNSLKIGAASKPREAVPSSSSNVHSSNSLSSKLSSNSIKRPSSVESGTTILPRKGNEGVSTKLSSEISQPMTAPIVSKNRSVLDSLYTKKTSTTAPIELKAPSSEQAVPETRKIAAPTVIIEPAIIISKDKTAPAVVAETNISSGLFGGAAVYVRAPVTVAVQVVPASLTVLASTTIIPAPVVDVPHLAAAVHVTIPSEQTASCTSAATTASSCGASSLGGALDRFGKSIKAPTGPTSAPTAHESLDEGDDRAVSSSFNSSWSTNFRRSSYPTNETVSDNFVRKNLKPRKKFSYKKDRQAAKPEVRPTGGKYGSHLHDAHFGSAAASSSAAGGYNLAGSSGDEGSDDEAMRALHAVAGGGGAGAGSAGDVSAVGGGLSSWGLDPLALSLKAIEVQTELTAAPTKMTTPSSSSSTSTAVPKASRGVRMTKILASVNMNPDTAGGTKKIRGLDMDTEVKRKKEKRNATVLYGVQKQLKNGGASHGVTAGREEVQLLLELYAPKCPGHQMAAKLVTVKKTGANKGKQFYACTFPREQQCKFFMWAEDNPELIAATVKANKTPSSTTAAYTTNKNTKSGPSEVLSSVLSGAEQWIVHAIQSYQVKLQGLSKSELKEEVVRCNRKNVLMAQKAVKLNVGGSVSELIERLSAEALRVLTAQCGPCEADAEDSEEEGEGEKLMELSDGDGSDDDELVIAVEEVKNKAAPVEVKARKIQSAKKAVESDSEESMEISVDGESESDDSSVGMRGGRKRGRSAGKSKRGSRVIEEEEDVSDGGLISGDDRDGCEDAMSGKDELTQTLRRTFGFSSFREGQRWSIERSLAGRSSLLVLPTGSGKSLCYMLPTALLPGLTIVVSPLLSLMNDQLKKLPVELPGACFSGGLTAQKAAYLCENILKGHIKILFISPERLCTPAFHRLMRLLKQQAQYKGPEAVEHVVSLLCLDEAHCLSQWSYNFRPAFLRIKREIRNISPRAVLALTATASRAIQIDIMQHLGIDASEGLLALPSHRKNLLLSSCVCENENAKRASILKLVSNPIVELSPMEDGSSAMQLNRSKRSKIVPLTIVYVWRRDEADALGEYLQGSNVDTVVYHAGMDADAREKAQQKFDRGTVKCVVATVAFGMGVDKSDVRQIIHHSMPKAIENYVQEVGRAGRDGKQSACRMFCNREDATRQHSLGNSSRVTSTQIVGLLLQVFRLLDPTATAVSEVPFVDRMHGMVSVSVSAIENSLDISAASMETILSILELQPFQLVSVKGSYYDTVGGRFRVTDAKLKELEQVDVLIRAILKLNQTERKVKPKSMNSNSSGKSTWASGASYGLGLGNYQTEGGSDEDEQGSSGRGAGNTYGSAITEFSCSRLAVAKECDLTPEEVSSGLYSLQRRGLLEYTLTNSSLYVQIAGSTAGPDSLLQMSTSSGFHSWIHEVAEGVAGVLNKITKLSGDRIINMWQVANTIAAFSAVPTESSASAVAASMDSSDEFSRECIQDALQHFVSHAMDKDGSSHDTQCCETELFALILDHYQNKVEPAFMDNSPLVAITNADKEAVIQLTSKQFDVKRRLTSDVLLLLRDPGLNDMVERIISLALVDMLQKQQIVSKKSVRCELMSLYVCKVLHGLSSTLLPAAVWRGSPSWGRYKDFCYDDLMTAVQYLASNNVL